jgi:hypothetical protein
MGIESFIRKVCVQTAVYWGNPKPDGFGGMTFDYPIEVMVRWDFTQRAVLNQQGIEINCDASVLSPEDLEREGMLFLGTLDDLWNESTTSSGGLSDPKNFEGAIYSILKVEKVAMPKKTTFAVKTYSLSKYK